MDVTQVLAASSWTQGMLTRSVLQGVGVGKDAVTRAAQDGRIVRLHPGTYGLAPLGALPPRLVVDGVPVPEYAAAVRAALLSLGDGAAAVSTTAAVLRGWSLLAEPTVVQVGVRHGRGRARLPGVVVRQLRAWDVEDLAVLPQTQPMPVASAATTAMHCCARLPVLSAVVAVDSALRSGQVDLEHLRVRAGRLPGLRRAAHARRVLELCDPRSGSVLESVMRVHLVRAGITSFGTQRVIVGPAGHVLRADFCFERERLVLEVDGSQWHQDVVKDRRTDNALAALGWRVLRYSWADVVHDTAATLAEIRAACAPEDIQSWSSAAA